MRNAYPGFQNHDLQPELLHLLGSSQTSNTRANDNCLAVFFTRQRLNKNASSLITIICKVINEITFVRLNIPKLMRPCLSKKAWILSTKAVSELYGLST
jgi:ABC-type cobalamin transport system permease subunit